MDEEKKSIKVSLKFFLLMITICTIAVIIIIYSIISGFRQIKNEKENVIINDENINTGTSDNIPEGAISYYKDENIESIVYLNKVPEDDYFNAFDEYVSSNISLKDNRKLDTKYIMEKVITKEDRKEIDKTFIAKFDEFFAEYKEKENANDSEFNVYEQYFKCFNVEQYISDMDSNNVCIYVNENKKFEIAVKVEGQASSAEEKENIHNLIIPTNISVDKLFEDNDEVKENKNIAILKPTVLDYAISDFVPKEDELEKYQRRAEELETYELENAYFDEVLPQKALDLYGKYLPWTAVGDEIGGVQMFYTASSTYDDGMLDYNVNNLANEYNKNKSWVEGVEGHGIGEKITTYTMRTTEFIHGNIIEGYYEPVESYRKSNKEDVYWNEMTGIYLVNGYAQNEKVYKNNSRVKKLKLTIDDKVEYILEVEDTMKSQLFDIDYKTEYSKEKIYPIKAEFEILEVYEGNKYQDTAINTLRINVDNNVASGGR